MKKIIHTPYFLPILLTLLSFLIRLSLISKGPFHIDCLDLAIQSEKTLLTGKLHPMLGSGYPLTVLLGSFFIFVLRLFSFTDPVFAVNVMSVVLSSLSIGIFYLIIEHLLNKSAAFFAAAMFSVYPLFLALSTYGKSHTPSLFFLFCGIFYLLHAQKDKPLKNLILSSVTLGLMGATRLQDFLFMSIPISWLFLIVYKELPLSFTTKNTFLKTFFLYWINAFALTLFFHLVLFLHNIDIYSERLALYFQLSLKVAEPELIADHVLICLKLIRQTLSPMGFTIAVLGLILIAFKNKSLCVFLILWIAVPLAFYDKIITLAPRMLVICTIPLIISQAYTFAYLFQTPKYLTKTICLLCFIVISWSIFSSVHPVLLFRHNHALLPNFAKWLKNKTEPNAKFIVADEIPFIEYYTERKVIPRPLSILSISQEELTEIKESIDDNLSQNIPIYIIETGLYGYDPKKVFSNFIKDNYDLQLKGKQFMEDWHQGELIQHIYFIKTYQLTTKTHKND